MVSIALSAPVSSAIPCILLPTLLHLSYSNLISSILFGLTLLAVAPMYIVWAIERRLDIGIDVPDRNTRLLLFPVAMTCQILSVVAFVIMHIGDMIAFSALCLTVTAAIFLLNLRFKASIHAAALAGSITALALTFGPLVLPAYLFLVPVVWSRRKLRVHRLGELLVGALVGLLLGALLYRLPDLWMVIKF